MKVVASGAAVPTRLRSYCEEQGIDVDLLGSDPGEEELRQAILGADYYLLGGNERLSEGLLAAAPKLKAVSFLGAGAASFIDVDAANARGVQVMTTPGANAAAVAEFAVGQALGIRRRLFINALGSDEVTRNTAELSGSRVGILGLGAVGSDLARILISGFGCHVSYSSLTRKPGLEADIGVKYVEVDELFGSSSTVFICCALTKATTGLVGAELLGSGVEYIVSISDSRVLVLDELARALSDGSLLGVALDGDYPGASIVSTDSNTILEMHLKRTLFVTQHIAASSTNAWERMQDQAVDNLIHAIESKLQ